MDLGFILLAPGTAGGTIISYRGIFSFQ